MLKRRFSGMLKRIFSFNSGWVSVISMIAAVLVSGIIIALCGYNAIEAFTAIFKGSFGSFNAVIQTFTQATPLIFSGLAFTFAKRAGLINLGMEGQIYIGAIVAAIIGSIDFGISTFLHLPLAMLAGAGAGGIYGGLAGLLKAKYGSNEVISTLMLNFIAISFTSYLVNGPLKAPGAVPQTASILETAMLPRLFPRQQLSIAIFIVIALAIIIKYFMSKTPKGFEIRVVGYNHKAAETAGINIGRTIIIAMFISGAIAGLGGTCHVLGVDRRFIDGFSPGYGFDGIAVAALAAGNPVLVIVSGIIFGALRAGAMELNMMTNIPSDFISVIQALVVIFVAAPMLVECMLGLGKRKKLKGALNNGHNI